MKPSIPTHHTLLISKLLDLHLSRAIEREHFKDRVMRKFIQLAEDVEADLKELDADADALQARRQSGKERAKNVVNRHHKLQDGIDAGISAMEAIADAAGIDRSNSRTEAELAAIEAEEREQALVLEAKKTLPPEQFEKWKADRAAAKLNGNGAEHQTVTAEEIGDAGAVLAAPESPVEPPKLGEASGATPPDVTFPKPA